MPSRASGFRKAAVEAGDLGGLLGAGLAYALTGNRPTLARVGASILGAQAGRGVVEGIEGHLRRPDFSGLSTGERRVIQGEAAKLQSSRNRRRFTALGVGAGTLLLTGDPLVLAAALPAATILPYSGESRYIAELADKYRAARQAEE